MESFNVIQARQYTRSTNIENFGTKNDKKISVLKPLQKQLAKLAANNSQIDSLAPGRGQDGEGTTTDKDKQKTKIGETVNDICSLVIPYALDIEDTTLYNAVNHTTSSITDLRDIAVLGFVNTLTTAITPLLSSPDFADYPVTAQQLDDLVTDATAFQDNLGSNKMIDNSASAASANIDILLADNRVIIGKINKLFNYFLKTDPGFVKEYHDIAALDNTGIHHSGIKGIIINPATEAPVNKVSVILKGKTSAKSTLTAEDGTYEIAEFRAGKCKLTITAPGYESQVIDVTIIRSKTLELNISLQSQIIKLDKTA